MPISIGNRVTEKDIRDWLDANGFVGRTAKINDLELHAIERPGWVQVFEFQMRSKIRPAQISTYQDKTKNPKRNWSQHGWIALALSWTTKENAPSRFEPRFGSSKIERDSKPN